MHEKLGNRSSNLTWM